MSSEEIRHWAEGPTGLGHTPSQTGHGRCREEPGATDCSGQGPRATATSGNTRQDPHHTKASMRLHRKQPVEQKQYFLSLRLCSALYCFSVDWAGWQIRKHKELSPGWQNRTKDACGAERRLINNWNKRQKKTAVGVTWVQRKGNDL